MAFLESFLPASREASSSFNFLISPITRFSFSLINESCCSKAEDSNCIFESSREQFSRSNFSWFNNNDFSSICFWEFVFLSSSLPSSAFKEARPSVISRTCSSRSACSRTRSAEESAISFFLSSKVEILIRMVFSLKASFWISFLNCSEISFFSAAVASWRLNSCWMESVCFK